MGDRFEVRLSGSGGQGLILVGKVLAEAAAVYEDKNATQSQSYGPEARGGASRSDVIISDEDIDYPKAVALDVLLALTQESVDKYVPDLKQDGTLIVDSDNIHRRPTGSFDLVGLPITKIAEDTVGRKLVANIVALGVLVAVSGIVSPRAAEMAILARVPKGTEELNIQAFRAGMDAAVQLEEE